MEIENYVFITENFLDEITLKKLTQYMKNDIEWEKASIITDGNKKYGLVDEKVRKVKSKFITNLGNEKCTSIFWFNFLKHSFMKFTLKYFDIIGNAHPKMTEHFEINFLKYEETNFYMLHSDYHHTTPRQLSYIFVLNDDYEGGEITFHFSKKHTKTFKISKNMGVVFPSNFIFTHHINPVTSGTRYVVVGWMA
ncbi:MAG TPA: hypothetical protein DCS66_14790 [Flavobacteriaceae bacterium]|jgi:hypothetical protein|nr:hypothetical protein [Flavobacteriaceae bacterium]|tara:strand:+ start:670 stop:1251 length:582 start_codon:yes stop_codon:yes gene_type:complete